MITRFENFNFKFYKDGGAITYSGVILDKESREKLLSTFIYPDPRFENWSIIAHHCTICFGGLPSHLKRYYLNEEVTLTVVAFGCDENAAAVKVDGIITINKPHALESEGPKFPHVTLAVSPQGKPSMSNDIKEWESVEPFEISGVIKEIEFL